MENNNNIVQELQPIAPILANAQKQMLYAVPPTYFEDLSVEILNIVLLNTLPKNNLPYNVPLGYFEGLSNSILNKINTSTTAESAVTKELQEIAPILSTINKGNIYSVPANYFSTINISKIAEKSTAKVVTMPKTKKWFSYAIAASFVGILVFGAVFFSNKNDGIDYAAYKKIDVTNSLNTLSNDELLNYLDNVNTITSTNSIAVYDVKIPEIQEHVKYIPDEELKEYLKESDMPFADEKLGI